MQRLLVVDDEPNIQFTIAETLGSDELEVIAAGTARAVAACQCGLPVRRGRRGTGTVAARGPGHKSESRTQVHCDRQAGGSDSESESDSQ